MRVLVLGDIMMGRYVTPLINKNGLRHHLRRLLDYLDCDHIVCNLESLLLPKKFEVTILSAPSSFSKELRDSGIDAVSLANNHILDLGETGLSATMESLKEQEIAFFGADVNLDQAKNVVTFELNDQRIGFMSPTYIRPATESNYGVLPMYQEETLDEIALAKNSVDYISSNGPLRDRVVSVPPSTRPIILSQVHK